MKRGSRETKTSMTIESAQSKVADSADSSQLEENSASQVAAARAAEWRGGRAGEGATGIALRATQLLPTAGARLEAWGVPVERLHLG